VPAGRINPRLIKIHRSYSVEDAARVLGVHKNSVRGWIKDGLPTCDNLRPMLVQGSSLRAFLEARRKAAKRPCPPGKFYCFKCRQPMSPALGMVDFRAHSDTSGNLSALCEACGTAMHRRTRFSSLAVIMPNLDVQIREAEPRLIGLASPSLNCDKRKD
jgi:RNase P subunit RPR2